MLGRSENSKTFTDKKASYVGTNVADVNACTSQQHRWNGDVSFEHFQKKRNNVTDVCCAKTKGVKEGYFIGELHVRFVQINEA